MYMSVRVLARIEICETLNPAHLTLAPLERTLMKPQWLEELTGVAVGAVIFGLFVFFGTIVQLSIGSRDGITVCYEQKEPAGVSTGAMATSLSVSLFPLALHCNWKGGDGSPVSAVWPNLVPTFVSTGGLLIAIGGGVVVLRENRRSL
jgi:uncharacterized membrane protein YczE